VGLLNNQKIIEMNTIRNIIIELKQTNWPSIGRLLQLTGYTLLLCAVVAIMMLGLDLLFFELRDLILNI
jgi:preprotein translocase subunit SecE